MLESDMIRYRYSEEKMVALFLADALQDKLTKSIIQKGQLSDREHLGW